MKANSGVGASDSFYFLLKPQHFKVEHGFAKTIKPNTTYRLALFKGYQKVDQMSEPVKAKLVGGKILFDGQQQLSFYLPLFSPNRSIQFGITLIQNRPEQVDTQIATYQLNSSTYIQHFKQQKTTHHKQQITLVDNLVLVFDLFVHNSKKELDQIVKQQLQQNRAQGRKDIANSQMRTPSGNQISSEIHSQSDKLSETHSGVFKKKINRKRGHDGHLRSKQGSRDNSPAGSSKSRSSRKSFGRFPRNEQNQHYLHSPKKVSPPKVEEESKGAFSRSAKRGENQVMVGKKDSNLSEIKPTTPRRSNKIESNIERAQSTRRRSGSKDKDIHGFNIVTNQPMFDLERRIDRQRTTPKNSNAPGIPKSNILPTATVENDLVEQEPVSKPSQDGPKIARKIVTVGGGQPQQRPYTRSGKQQGQDSIRNTNDRAPAIAIKGSQVRNTQETGENKLKLSILSTGHRQEEEAEEAARRQFSGMKDTLFYTVFVILSILLFWNAVTPSRKV